MDLSLPEEISSRRMLITAYPPVAQRRVPHSPDLMTSTLSLADQIAMTGHALTANELSKILAVSRITIFKQAKAGRILSFRIGTCQTSAHRGRR